MPRTVSNEATIDDPALIERVAIAIFEKTQGSWEYAREADREWLRLEAQAAIVTFFKVHRGTRSDFRRFLELILRSASESSLSCSSRAKGGGRASGKTFAF